jgi:predicted Rossmann fold flavoprotein
MSGWWRCNFSNTEISPEKYFGENKKMLPSVFHKYNNQDMVEFLETNEVETNIEDNWRIILKSGKAKQLLDLISKKSEENQTEIKLNQDIVEIKKDEDIFIIKTSVEEFRCNKLIIATGWVSYPKYGTTWYWLDLAKQFDLEITKPYPALCWIETQEDLSNLSWSSVIANVKLFNNSKIIYQQTWNLLFTHRWLSGPVIFNTTAAIWEYLSKKWKYNNEYIQTNTHIEVIIPDNQITKRLKQSELLITDRSNNSSNVNLKIKDITAIETAKVSGWWISMSEIKPNFESKKIPNLYFIWETLDITGQTGWFNLQRAWSSGYICGENL